MNPKRCCHATYKLVKMYGFLFVIHNHQFCLSNYTQVMKCKVEERGLPYTEFHFKFDLCSYADVCC